MVENQSESLWKQTSALIAILAERQTDGGWQYDFELMVVQPTTLYARSDFPNNIYRLYHFRPHSALNIHKHCTLPTQHIYGFIVTQDEQSISLTAYTDWPV
jgi:hypothetical protein